MVFDFNFKFFFIKLFYIFLKFQDERISSAKSKILTILTVLLITVNVWKGSMTKSLSAQYEKVYVLCDRSTRSTRSMGYRPVANDRLHLIISHGLLNNQLIVIFIL